MGVEPTVTHSRHTLVLKTRPSTGQDWLPPSSLSAARQAKRRGPIFHRFDAEGDVLVEVEASLRKVSALIDEINRKWPFERDTKVKLP